VEPVVFEALASLSGDVANESVQHSELAASINKDVLQSLARLAEGQETVRRIVSLAPNLQQQRATAGSVRASRRTFAAVCVHQWFIRVVSESAHARVRTRARAVITTRCSLRRRSV
jgi:hypothetical protein